MGTLKDCPTCGYKTTRDFCTPDCRMRDSDNRIEFVEEERDELKKKVEELEDENDRLKKFAINLEFQTNTRMQNFMVQSVYDRINKDCREVLLSKQIQDGE